MPRFAQTARAALPAHMVRGRSCCGEVLPPLPLRTPARRPGHHDPRPFRSPVLYPVAPTVWLSWFTAAVPRCSATRVRQMAFPINFALRLAPLRGHVDAAIDVIRHEIDTFPWTYHPTSDTKTGAR